MRPRDIGKYVLISFVFVVFQALGLLPVLLAYAIKFHILTTDVKWDQMMEQVKLVFSIRDTEYKVEVPITPAFHPL